MTGLALSAYVDGGRYDYMTLRGRQHLRRLSCDWTERNTLSHIQVAPLPPVWISAAREDEGE